MKSCYLVILSSLIFSGGLCSTNSQKQWKCRASWASAATIAFIANHQLQCVQLSPTSSKIIGGGCILALLLSLYKFGRLCFANNGGTTKSPGKSVGEKNNSTEKVMRTLPIDDVSGFTIDMPINVILKQGDCNCICAYLPEKQQYDFTEVFNNKGLLSLSYKGNSSVVFDKNKFYYVIELKKLSKIDRIHLKGSGGLDFFDRTNFSKRTIGSSSSNTLIILEGTGSFTGDTIAGDTVIVTGEKSENSKIDYITAEKSVSITWKGKNKLSVGCVQADKLTINADGDDYRMNCYNISAEKSVEITALGYGYIDVNGTTDKLVIKRGQHAKVDRLHLASNCTNTILN